MKNWGSQVNDEAGSQALAEAMKAYPSALMVMEATGGLERLSACALEPIRGWGIEAKIRYFEAGFSVF